MSFERYVDYMLDVPMYFIKRHDRYFNVAGQSFRDFLKGSLKLSKDFSESLQPTRQDWHHHLTTAFPEVRLKHYLEMRGADGGPAVHAQSLPAFWTGLLYDVQAMASAQNLIQDWSFSEIEDLSHRIGEQGLNTSFRQRPLKEWAEQFLDLSQQGLERRSLYNEAGQDESVYLNYLQKILKNNQTYAQKLLQDDAQFERNVEKILQENIF